MAVPPGDTSRLVSDYQAVNSQVEQTPKVMTDLLRGLDCNVWVDDVFYFAEDEISLLCLLDDSWPVGECWFVRRCSQVHFFRSRMVWCGNVYSDGDRSHKPLAFLSGSFKGSQLRWATVDKEAFAIVNTFRRLEYLLWGRGSYLYRSSQSHVHFQPRSVRNVCY